MIRFRADAYLRVLPAYQFVDGDAALDLICKAAAGIVMMMEICTRIECPSPRRLVRAYNRVTVAPEQS